MCGRMDAWMYGWMPGRMNVCMDAYMDVCRRNVCIAVCLYGCVDVRRHGWMDVWMY